MIEVAAVISIAVIARVIGHFAVKWLEYLVVRKEAREPE